MIYVTHVRIVFQLPSRIIVHIFLVMRSRSLITPPTKYIRVGSPSTHSLDPSDRKLRKNILPGLSRFRKYHFEAARAQGKGIFAITVVRSR